MTNKSPTSARAGRYRSRAMLAVAGLCLAFTNNSAVAQSDFYATSAADSVGAPGTLIRYEPLPTPHAGGHAYRILYLSTGLDGRPVPVSGMVVVPDGPAPASGRPVIAWAHPTTGVVQGCAPSLSPLRFMMISGLKDMLDGGFVVAATDYPGLGAGTNHPFLDGASEGRAVLDAVRAAASIPGAGANSQYALWGHSQGGQAVLFAADMAAQYAPELKLAGVAAAAPATDLGALLRDDLGTTGGNNLTALTLWAWNNVYGADYSRIVEPQALVPIQTIAGKCIDTLIESPAKKDADKLLANGFITVPDVTAVEPWHTLMARNSAPLLPRGLPLFLAQGDADIVVHPAVTRAYAARVCAAGTRVAFLPLPGVGHGMAAAKGAKEAIAWISGRMNGATPQDDCAALTGGNQAK